MTDRPRPTHRRRRRAAAAGRTILGEGLRFGDRLSDRRADALRQHELGRRVPPLALTGEQLDHADALATHARAAASTSRLRSGRSPRRAAPRQPCPVVRGPRTAARDWRSRGPRWRRRPGSASRTRPCARRSDRSRPPTRGCRGRSRRATAPPSCSPWRAAGARRRAAGPCRDRTRRSRPGRRRPAPGAPGRAASLPRHRPGTARSQARRVVHRPNGVSVHLQWQARRPAALSQATKTRAGRICPRFFTGVLDRRAAKLNKSGAARGARYVRPRTRARSGRWARRRPW